MTDNTFNESAESQTIAQNKENNTVVNNEDTMENSNPQTDAPKTGAEVQPTEEGIVNSQTENNSTEQENDAQATTGASPVDTPESKEEEGGTTPLTAPDDTNGGKSDEEDMDDEHDTISPSEEKVSETSDEKSAKADEKRKKKEPDRKDIASSKGLNHLSRKVKTPTKKSYKPDYDVEELAKLKIVTKVCDEEIARVIHDPRYYAIPYANGSNCLIDLHKAYVEGKIQLVSPVVNRDHGADQEKTGESMLTYGAQHILIVMTVKMAKAAGLIPKRFKNDKNGNPIPDDALVMMDGNGRVNFLMGIAPEDWPEIYAVFPRKDASGYYNLNKSFDIINTQVSVWKSQDMVQKRRLMDGENAHPGWSDIDTLVKNGYMYQSACQLITLGVDRIKKTEVTNGDDKEIFKFYDYAIQIFEALKDKFGEGTDKTIKTKVFTQEVSIIWRKLNDTYEAEKATEYFLDFLNQLPEAKVKAIKEAESKKGGATKDEQRKDILNTSFTYYAGANQLNIG